MFTGCGTLGHGSPRATMVGSQGTLTLKEQSDAPVGLGWGRDQDLQAAASLRGESLIGVLIGVIKKSSTAWMGVKGEGSNHSPQPNKALQCVPTSLPGTACSGG